MRPPTPDEQIQFLANLQRLLDEGQFVASYKFALLLSLADLSVEKGDDSGSPLTLTTDEIGERFIQYYWRQAAPYPAGVKARVLQQNIGKQAAVLNIVRAARERHGDSLAAVMKQPEIWNNLRRNTAAVVRIMPLWKLQTVGRERLDFLYENTDAGKTIDLRPGVAYCFRRFHALISDLVRGAWVRYVRQQNLNILGEAADLNEFLFGSERAALAVVRPVLIDIQERQCFYCNERLSPASTHVDHFIPWARYPVDLGHNFVLADRRCNSQKRDRLPAYNYLAAWTERNLQYGDQIGTAMEERGIVSELAASNRVAQWAYAQTESAGGLTWLRADELVPLAVGWRSLF
jgi:5-methylcytosine-specific restriction endonuclease McrA